MNTNEILQYGQEKPGAEASFPFDNETLVLKVGGKIFLMMSLEKHPLTISVKTDPERSVVLRSRYPQIKGAYHMNKKHWNSMVCEGIPAQLVREMIDESYELVFKSLKKELQLTINQF